MPLKNMHAVCDALYYLTKLNGLLFSYAERPSSDTIDEIEKCYHHIQMLEEGVWEFVNKYRGDTIKIAALTIKRHRSMENK